LAIFEARNFGTEEMKVLAANYQSHYRIFTNIGTHTIKTSSISGRKSVKNLTFLPHRTLIYCSDIYDIQERIIKSGIQPKNVFLPGVQT
jgi:hypothetical protein